jgi:hypothetical protein
VFFFCRSTNKYAVLFIPDASDFSNYCPAGRQVCYALPRALGRALHSVIGKQHPSSDLASEPSGSERGGTRHGNKD